MCCALMWYKLLDLKNKMNINKKKMKQAFGCIAISFRAMISIITMKWLIYNTSSPLLVYIVRFGSLCIVVSLMVLKRVY